MYTLNGSVPAKYTLHGNLSKFNQHYFTLVASLNQHRFGDCSAIIGLCSVILMLDCPGKRYQVYIPNCGWGDWKEFQDLIKFIRPHRYMLTLYKYTFFVRKRNSDLMRIYDCGGVGLSLRILPTEIKVPVICKLRVYVSNFYLIGADIFF